ncbi:MAG TPA: hypothetical protein VFV96_04820 [Verrucomicrobiae bacterium]|nr:hypothetical protein [Verrucomicrobiae bacterium]
MMAAYFASVVFWLVAWPPISRALRAGRPPEFSAQTQQKIDTAVQDAIRKVLVEEGHPEGVPVRRSILWHLIKHRTPYDPTVWQHAEEKLKLKKIQRLHQSATALGFKLTTTT